MTLGRFFRGASWFLLAHAVWYAFGGPPLWGVVADEGRFVGLVILHAAAVMCLYDHFERGGYDCAPPS